MDELRVVRAGFAPVKGTRHLPYAAVRLDEQGPVGDRGYALVDLSGGPERIQVLKTVQNPTLVAVRAELVGQRLDVVLPDGTSASAEPVPTGEVVKSDYWGRPTPLELVDGPHAELFSRWLGRPVRLAKAGRGDVVFAGSVTIVGTASIRDLAEKAGEAARAAKTGLARIDQAARFRPTFVVETDEPFVEETWLAHRFALGSGEEAPVVRIGVPIPRCAVIDLEPSTGARGTRLLKTLASYRPLNSAGEPAFGVFAEVTVPGVARVEPASGSSPLAGG